MDYLQKTKDILEFRNDAKHTIKTYSTYISAYLEYLEEFGIEPEKATWDTMRGFLMFLKSSRNLKDRTINNAISQLRFFTEYVLGKEWDRYKVPMRKFDEFLPYVPTRDVVETFINSIDDVQLKTMVILMYSCGLRVSEVCNLRYEDISRKEMKIHISRSKNRTDRYVPLSEVTLQQLTQYWYLSGKPRGYLFRTQSGEDSPVYSYYVSKSIADQEKKLGWEHKLVPHTFRHAFATHFYEDTRDPVLLKNRLGHKSINSTMIYIRLAAPADGAPVSPIDKLSIR